MRPQSVEKRTLTGFGIALLVVLAIAGLTYTTTQRSLEDTRAAGHFNNVIAALEHVRSQLYQTESSERGYRITGAPQYLALRDEAIAGCDDVAKTDPLSRFLGTDYSPTRHRPIVAMQGDAT